MTVKQIIQRHLVQSSLRTIILTNTMNQSGSFRKICLQLSKAKILVPYPQEQMQKLPLRDEQLLAEHSPIQPQQTSEGLKYVLGK